MPQAPAPIPSTDDARALDLLNSSGVLNPHFTLDKLMEVTRELAELQPSSSSTAIGPGLSNNVTINVFLHSQFCYTFLR
jgi:hypothetical protein